MKKIVTIITLLIALSTQSIAFYDGTINEGRGGERGDSYGGARI